MSAPGEPVFVDTNILVYVYERGNESRNIASRALLDDLMGSGALRLSAQVLQELYVTLTRKAKMGVRPELAAAWVADLARWPVQSVDYALVAEAMRLSREAVLSYWDALIVVAAARSGASLLYSEDLNHGQALMGVEIVNPFRGIGII